MLACFGFGKSQVKEKKRIYPFTSFVLKVDATGAWESAVAKVLKKTKLDISNLKMHDDGMFQVSGTLDPIQLLKVLGKSGKAAQLVGWQVGGCSRNLHMPEFEQRQRYKQYLKYLADMNAYYNDALQSHGGGHGRGNHGYNYGNGYGRSYGNAHYLPSGHHHPHAPFPPTYGYPRY